MRRDEGVVGPEDGLADHARRLPHAPFALREKLHTYERGLFVPQCE
jgi:hypothetical protein